MFYADLLLGGSLDKKKKIQNISYTIMIRDSEFLRYDYSSVLYASENAFIFLDRYFIKMTVYEIYF